MALAHISASTRVSKLRDWSGKPLRRILARQYCPRFSKAAMRTSCVGRVRGLALSVAPLSQNCPKLWRGQEKR